MKTLVQTHLRKITWFAVLVIFALTLILYCQRDNFWFLKLESDQIGSGPYFLVNTREGDPSVVEIFALDHLPIDRLSLKWLGDHIDVSKRHARGLVLLNWHNELVHFDEKRKELFSIDLADWGVIVAQSSIGRIVLVAESLSEQAWLIELLVKLQNTFILPRDDMLQSLREAQQKKRAHEVATSPEAGGAPHDNTPITSF